MPKKNLLHLHFFSTLLGGLLFLLLVPEAQTQNDLVEPWQASYWNNSTLSGTPTLVREETAVNYNWGNGSPTNAISPDRFSARWTGTLNLPAGRYRFTVQADDGVRLWLSNQLAVDAWQPQAATLFTAIVVTAGGDVPVVLEYFENTGLAEIQLAWEREDSFVNRWQGEYFDNRSLDGLPVLVRPDSEINFMWGGGSPAPDLIDPETFSVRWTRSLSLPAGQYRFILTADDGARLWVNDSLLVDAWHAQAATTFERELSLPGGEVPVRLEYFENGGQATAQLSWQRIHEFASPSNSTLVDNRSAGFVRGGPDSDWFVENQGFNGTLVWSQNSEQVEAVYNWGRWYPTLTPGSYEVEVYIPLHFSTTTNARYWIAHADGYQLREIDQSANGDRWVSLGIYFFDGNGSSYVSLSDVTYEADSSRLVAYDAVRWTRIDGDGLAETAVIMPSVVSPGTQIVVRGMGFTPNSLVSVSLGLPNAEPIADYAQAVAAGDGTVVISFIMPATWPDGSAIATVSSELVALLLAENGRQATANFTFIP